VTDWPARLRAELDAVAARGQWRAPRVLDALGPAGTLDGRPVVSFAGNDYLGLSAHPAVIAAAQDAAARWGTGATASRLVVGTRPAHAALEEELAAWKGTEAALVLATGYAANVGVLTTLGGPGVLVVSDELNHASIIDGCRLSGAERAIAPHGDVAAVDRLLAGAEGPAIVVTDSVFSMDGDLAPVDDLVEVCARRGALLVVDEAHAVLGPHLPPDAALPATVVRVGTLSKALGSLGGFVAGSREVVDLLVNRARPFIFSTGLSPADTEAARVALALVRAPEGEALVTRLRTLVDRVRPGWPSPILPVVVGEEDAAVAASAALLERGLLIPAIRPPTVAPGTSRLRVALSAGHTDEMVDRLLDGLAAVGLA